MNSSLTSLNDISASNKAAIESLDCLIVELEHYRRQSERLTCINDLHARLAGAVDVTSMIEAFSVWLMPLMEHDLIAYDNPERNRMHMFCSCHGPKRRRAMNVATKIFCNFDTYSDAKSWREGDFHVQNLPLSSSTGGDRLLLLRRNSPLCLPGQELMREVLDIINESLQRSLDYEDIFEQARHDALTGLANRRVFEERVEQLIQSCRRYGHPVTLASMDLDKFKQLNDTRGHAEGDLSLQKVALTMERMVRNSDLLVRMGGDEFVLVMQDTDLQAARILAERLRQAVEHLNIETGAGGSLGISIGLAQWQKNMTKDDWLQQADEALYQAKATGRSQVCIPAEQKTLSNTPSTAQGYAASS
jgi:diguanylate cyclase (GGDEF)-like protein